MTHAVLALAALASAQAPATVGDTVWAAVTVPVPARIILRPQPWDPGDVATVLGPPEVVYSGDSATIRYPAAFWYPGLHRVRLPGPILVSPEGQSDTLPARMLAVSIASVLPADTNRLALDPRPAAAPVAQAARSVLPLVLLLAFAAALLAAAWLAAERRRRRRQGAVAAPAVAAVDLPAVFDGWAGQGEFRAAVDGWAHVLEERTRRAGTPAGPRTAAWLEAAARAGFRSDRDLAELGRLLATIPAEGE